MKHNNPIKNHAKYLMTYLSTKLRYPSNPQQDHSTIDNDVDSFCQNNQCCV
ncbi:hypothetical protein Ark11_1616 [Candidatus Ichthyocystis hellenicum]|uniref:Uncharacterized protein n=1 Tax=Candidatus Ichthyocystis hellenicum TaxID=1561003 RepID=A0A0S4M3R2_9BURK|nr:hypothetical protein [Candidatus Ichthyocystis hellenicum]CUT18407.1 hypothetical protein Ark11_1616 [Candidatus Ichthyocystis hellenicum]